MVWSQSFVVVAIDHTKAAKGESYNTTNTAASNWVNNYYIILTTTVIDQNIKSRPPGLWSSVNNFKPCWIAVCTQTFTTISNLVELLSALKLLQQYLTLLKGWLHTIFTRSHFSSATLSHSFVLSNSLTFPVDVDWRLSIGFMKPAANKRVCGSSWWLVHALWWLPNSCKCLSFELIVFDCK